MRSISNVYGLWLSLAILVADQISKQWIHSQLEWYGKIVVTPWLNIVHLRNTGAAFSSFATLPQWFFVVLAVVVSLGMMIWLRRHPFDQRLVAMAFCCIIGGALGNVMDRVRHGYVVDFIDFHIGDWHYAAFNVADIAISIGAFLLILDMLREWWRSRGSAAA